MEKPGINSESTLVKSSSQIKKSKKSMSSKKTQTTSARNNIAERVKNKLFSKQSQSRTKKQLDQNRLTTKVGKYQIDMETVLGRGTFGQIYKANLIERPDEVFACKLISKAKLQRTEIYEDKNGTSLIQRLEDQIQTQKQLSDCKYIVKLFDVVKVENEGYYLFMELCDLDLSKLIKQKNNHLPENQALDFFKQLIKGYKHLYDHNISHRDLKPQNLLIQGGKNLKISDFGFVKIHSSPDLVLRSAQRGQCLAQSLVGSINYIAPDILLAQKYNKKYSPFISDVWSMGIILYKMLYGKQPYQAQQTTKLLQKIQTQPLQFPEQPKVSQKTKQIIRKMIDKDQTTRITFKKLYQECIGQESQIKQQVKSSNSALYSQKQRILVFYNLLITKISSDSAHFATLRQLGIIQYQRYSAKLMTLIHQKRLQILKMDKNIFFQIKKEILSYNQYFYNPIKQTSWSFNSSLNPPQQPPPLAVSVQLSQTLLNLLQTFKNFLLQYPQFQMLHQQVQYFLLLILLLYNYEKGFVSTDYIFTIIQKERNKKLNLKKLEELTKKNLQYK